MQTCTSPAFTGTASRNRKTAIEVPVDPRICSVLEVLAIVRTRSGGGHGYLIEFIPHGETRVRRKILSQAALLGRPEEALKALRDIGVSVLQKHAKLVRDYLDSQHLRFSAERPEDFWESVDLVGWHSPECFVLPSEIIGNQNGVWFNLCGEPAQYDKRGHLADWQQNVAALCVGNPYLLFAVSSSLSGPLLEPLNIQSIGNHLHGDSSTGKTTSLDVATSVWGPRDFRLTWSQTVNRLEEHAASRCDTALCWMRAI
jgi:putative DNA primase/helicase